MNGHRVEEHYHDDAEKRWEEVLRNGIEEPTAEQKLFAKKMAEKRVEQLRGSTISQKKVDVFKKAENMAISLGESAELNVESAILEDKIGYIRLRGNEYNNDEKTDAKEKETFVVLLASADYFSFSHDSESDLCEIAFGYDLI